MKFQSIALLLLTGAISAPAANGEDTPPCNPESRTFTAKLDIYASELGYYQFEECGDAVNPTLGIEVGETYTFVQKDPSNFYHPLGFAYFPDGAHADKDELEPGITQSGSACAQNMTCPAPMYLLNGEPLGTYSNDASVAPVSVNEDNFGLDEYEPRFFLPLGDWVSQGEFSIKLNFDDASYDKDIFYFCHVHEFMSGRIKLLSGGVPTNTEDDPPLGYSYQTVDNDFDKFCGTWGLDPFQLPHGECPARFVCLTDDAQDKLDGSDVLKSKAAGEPMSIGEFAQCIDAVDCHMMAKMTTKASSGSPNALFIHQMIPHHQNAINMAKSLLKANTLQCGDDLSNDEIPDCVLESILRSIIVDQNHQIQLMRGYLEDMNFTQEDDCVVPIEKTETEEASDESAAAVSGLLSSFIGLVVVGAVAAFGW